MTTQHIFTDAYRPTAAALILPDLTHCAVGDGAVTGPPLPTATGLLHELGRVRYSERFFVAPDPAGTLVFDGVAYATAPDPTRFAYFRFRFDPSEALGTWTELGLFGNGVTYVERGATLVDMGVAGDEVLNVDVVLGGTWALPGGGDLLVTVTVGGPSGVAEIEWADSGGNVGNGGPVPVTFGTPVPLGGSGLQVVFTGGADGVLTPNDRWRVLATPDPVSQDYAAGGVYDPNSNRNGQVLNPGTLVRLSYLDPVASKSNLTLDVQFLVEIIRP
jgi:hypothetical protein